MKVVDFSIILLSLSPFVGLALGFAISGMMSGPYAKLDVDVSSWQGNNQIYGNPGM